MMDEMDDVIYFNIDIKMTGNPNIKRSSKAFIHHKPSKELHCTLASILQDSGSVLARWKILSILPKDFPSVGVTMMVLENTVWRVTLWFNWIEMWGVWRPSRIIDLIFILLRPFRPLWDVDGGGVILKETTPIRIEMIHHRIQMITRKNFLLSW